MRPISPGSLRFFFSCANAVSCLCSEDNWFCALERSDRWWSSDVAGNQAKSTTAATTTAPRNSTRLRRVIAAPSAAVADGRARPRRFLGAATCATSASQGGPSGEGGRLTQVLFDPQQLVVLGDAVRARRCARLDLPRVHGDG